MSSKYTESKLEEMQLKSLFLVREFEKMEQDCKIFHFEHDSFKRYMAEVIKMGAEF